MAKYCAPGTKPMKGSPTPKGSKTKEAPKGFKKGKK